MKALAEDIWAALPQRLEPYALKPRRDYLLAHVDPGQRVLDLGCGEGTFAAILAEAGAAPVGVDIAEVALQRARALHPTLDFRLSPAEGPLPVDDADVDVVWASEVIGHVVDTAAFFSEIRRVLRPGGRVLITTPYHGRVRNLALALAGFERHFDPRGPQLRFYTRGSLERLLRDFGFDDLRLQTSGGPPLLRHTLVAGARRARVVVARG